MIGDILISALLVAAAPSESPDALVLTNTVEAPEAAEVAAGVDTFLKERIEGAWGLTALSEAPADAGRLFRVHLTWTDPTRVVLRIKDDDEVLVDREAQLESKTAARAVVWLLVRSTIERVLLRMSEPPAPDPTPAIEPVEPIELVETTEALSVVEPSGVQVESALEAEDDFFRAEEPTPLAEPVTQTATLAEASPQPARGTERRTTTSSAPRRSPLMRLFSEPLPWSNPSGVSAALMTRGRIDNAGFSGGFAFQLRLLVTPWFTTGIEGGYWGQSDRFDLSIDHIPLGVFAGIRPLDDFPLELGVRFGADIKSIQSSGNSGLGLGVYSGGYGRADFSLFNIGDHNVSLTAELGVELVLLRQSYVINGLRTTDAPLALQLGGGIQWRWH